MTHEEINKSIRIIIAEINKVAEAMDNAYVCVDKHQPSDDCGEFISVRIAHDGQEGFDDWRCLYALPDVNDDDFAYVRDYEKYSTFDWFKYAKVDDERKAEIERIMAEKEAKNA